MSKDLINIISELDPLHQSTIYDYLLEQTVSIRSETYIYRFHAPNELLKYRANTFLSKEPETIEWINEYVDGVFWDIGANIGLYSIYAAKRKNNVTVYSFEPSTTNLYSLSKNIILNECTDTVNLLPIALTNNSGFQKLTLQNLVEGNALNAFGVDYDYNGECFNGISGYRTYGCTIDDLITKFNLPLPEHIKIDVDGIEHLILKGGNLILNSKSLKTIQIEINEEFNTQKNTILKIMALNNFKIKHKKHASEFDNSKFSSVYNYLFINNNL